MLLTQILFLDVLTPLNPIVASKIFLCKEVDSFNLAPPVIHGL